MEAALRDVVLQRGLVDETGARHRRAALRPLTGREEADLGVRSGATAASRLLAACVVRLGGYRDVGEAHVAALSRGDRWRLALGLRQLMVGDQLVLTLTCPDPDCRQPADLVVRVSDLLGAPGEAEAEEFEVGTEDGPVHLRPPTGLDDEACEAAGGGRDEQSDLLWSRLVLDVGGLGPVDGDGWRGLRAATRQAVAGALAELDSLLDLSFVSACPECGAWIEVELDPFELLARELGLGAGRLLAEVHCLAFHYGWSEDAILDLPRTRRWSYLELLRNQLEGRPLGDHWS
ncbi:MAG TPA: hypothetical protein VHE80_01420 [Acidimicrobiales bacterium]|nr:hypothetical protein [Acidimicrobiales bacterium]